CEPFLLLVIAYWNSPQRPFFRPLRPSDNSHFARSLAPGRTFSLTKNTARANSNGRFIVRYVPPVGSMVFGARKDRIRASSIFQLMTRPAEQSRIHQLARKSGYGGHTSRTRRGFLVVLIVAILATGPVGALFAGGKPDPATGAQAKTIVFIPKS